MYNSCIIIIVMSLAFSPGFSQTEKVTYVPPSPNASALLEYASIPINLYTGTPEISIPLSQLKGRKLNVPLSISYHASGIKVQDLSSSVGLGFILNGPGIITRLVRGLPDEDPMGYLNQDFNTVFGSNSSDIAEGDIDTEPDIFFYNFNGKTGRFVLDQNKNPIQMPEQNLKIRAPDFSNPNPTWTITDVDGTRYLFGEVANSRETTSSTLKNPIKLKTYISSWYISTISDPFDTESISFTYQVGSNVYFENYRQYQASPIESVTNCQPPPGWPGYTSSVADIITEITINSPKYVSVISAKIGTSVLMNAAFTYANDRQDLVNALRLSQIAITNKDGVEIKKYSINNNQYFISDDCSDPECKRLKLNSITEITNGASLLLNTFYYSSANLPSRKSIKYDHWGYYNNNAYTSAIPPSKVYPAYGGTVSYPGADKSPDLLKTQANTLTSIVNAVGGSQNLIYALNDYDDSGILKSTGGLRIYQIVENDGTNVNATITRTFQYRKLVDQTKSSGVLYRKNSYEYKYVNSQPCPTFGTYGYSYIRRYSTSLIDFFDIGGIHVGYAQVQIDYSNGSKEQLEFTNFIDRPDDASIFTQPPGVSSPDFLDPDGPPFVSRGDRSYERGLLLQHTYLNATGKKVKRIKHEYDYYLASSLEAPGGKYMLLMFLNNASYHRAGKYIQVHRGVRRHQTIETTYDQFDENKYISNKNVYSYNSIYSLLIKGTTSYLNNGEVILKETAYPGDYSNFSVSNSDVESDGVYHLKSRYVISKPIEVVTSLKKPGWTNYRVIESKLTTFKRDLSNTNQLTNPYVDFFLKIASPITDFVPSAVVSNGTSKSFVKDSRYSVLVTYDTYDTKGNLTQETPNNGLVTSYQRSVDGSLVTSVTKSPTANPQTSTFEHIPFVGLSSITDPANRKSYYSYDKLNRLKLIKDNDLNIVSRYRYNYRDQNEFGIDLVLSKTSAPTGQIITFTSANEAQSIGITKYVWDFGDGQVVETSTNTVTRSYTTPGTYTVKLAKVNSEYGSVITSKSLVVFLAP